MPFFVYYRDVWTGESGRRGFRSREALERFVAQAPRRLAITYHN